MAVDTQTSTDVSLGASKTLKQSSIHPFASLSAQEIADAANLVRSSWPSNTSLQFKVITLQEPKKTDVIPVLDAESKGHTTKPPPRRAFVAYYLRNTDKFHEAIVNLSEDKLDSNVRMGPNVHGALAAYDIMKAEELIMQDAKVKEEVAKLELPAGAVIVCDPWIYGADGVDDDKLMIQAFLYMRDPLNPSLADSNHYALPLPISPVLNVETWEVIRVDYLPTGSEFEGRAPKPVKHVLANEYIPEAQKLRTDLKPLHVVQPEGASFKVTEQGTSNIIEWQKWSFRVGFNHREGMVLYNVRYDGRSLFYRMALSDMNIPYADPRPPYHKKSAFDLGDTGAGLMANNLKLGCDCLGSIHYLSGVITDDEGKPQPTENVICIHEQDGGIGWKHTNYRTGRGVLTRQRELVIQSIITVANYEYIMAFYFNQAAEVHYEIRATGILSTQPIDDGIDVPFGTVVHPGVLATHHQHIFSLRVDPAIDGHDNRLIYSETHAMPRDEKTNPHGTGYVLRDTLIEKSGGYDLDFNANRVYKIQNVAKKNPVNGKPIGYKIMAPPFQPLLSDEHSFNFKRAEFADRAIYAVKYQEDELYAGGKYTNQSRGGTGVRNWASRQDDIVDKDLVLFVQFGINHVPRIEDFPVMPCEVLRVMFKPVNFFEKNPALDVPPSEQKFNSSVLLSETHHQSTTNATINGSNGEPCCNGNSHVNGNTNGTYTNGVH